jgi:hypothetical protein
VFVCSRASPARRLRQIGTRACLPRQIEKLRRKGKLNATTAATMLRKLTPEIVVRTRAVRAAWGSRSRTRAPARAQKYRRDLANATRNAAEAQRLVALIPNGRVKRKATTVARNMALRVQAMRNLEARDEKAATQLSARVKQAVRAGVVKNVRRRRPACAVPLCLRGGLEPDACVRVRQTTTTAALIRSAEAGLNMTIAARNQACAHARARTTLYPDTGSPLGHPAQARVAVSAKAPNARKLVALLRTRLNGLRHLTNKAEKSAKVRRRRCRALRQSGCGSAH